MVLVTSSERIRMMQVPKVSIIIPVYNQEQFLAETFESLFAQTYGNIEIIAIDDGSRDGSVRALESFRDDRLIVKVQQNAGQAAAINRGLESAVGDLVKIMDGDDILSPNHIQAQVAAIAGQETMVASSRWTYFISNPATARFVDEKTDRDYNDPFDWILDTLTDSRGMFGAWQWLIPRAVIDHAGFWNEELSLEADLEFTIRVLLASNGIRFAEDAKLYYRKGVSSSMSRVKNKSFLESAIRATELTTARLLEKHDIEQMRRLCADRCQKWAFETYPSHPDLTARAESLVERYGGSELRLPGGIINQSFSSFLSWKVIRQLQEMVYRFGWQYVLRAKERKRNAKLQHPYQ